MPPLPMEGPLELLALPPIGWVLAGIWGALWGSFFNVCIYRVGLYESVSRPRSRCPSCGTQIGALENIPILSWIVLRGRCRHCRAPISVRYPLVEGLTACLALALYARFVHVLGPDAAAAGPIVIGHAVARFFVYFAFTGTLLVLAGIDLDHKLIPDRITYPAIPLFFVAQALLGDVPIPALLIGICAGYAIVAVTAELAYLLLGREGMGYGDAKLLALVGAMLGWRGVLVTFFAAPFIGLAVVLPALLVRRQRVVGAEIPYGPFLAGAAVAYLLFGRAISLLMSG